MSRQTLVEHIQPSMASIEVLTEGTSDDPCMYLEGVAIQGDVRNRNERVYPLDEIKRAVQDMQSRIEENGPIAGECDHPDNLTTSLQNTSHIIESIRLEDKNGIARFKIMPFGYGEVVQGLIKHGLKVGVSSRGSGSVDDEGRVSDFEIHTIDMVANPSAPGAYPKPIMEAIERSSRGREALSLNGALRDDPKAQSHFNSLLMGFLDELKVPRR